MNLPFSERRQIENEMIFRRANEKIGDGLEKLNAMHMADHNPQLVVDDDLLIYFRCECSDEDCGARIPIKLSTYTEIHKNRKAFVIKPQHQVDSIEKVVRTEDQYSVVEKNHSTAEPDDNKLNTTSVKNT